jgi:hypothetical protein
MPAAFPSGAKMLDQLAIQQAEQANAQLAQIHPVVDPTKPIGHQKAMLNQLTGRLDEAGNLVDEDQGKVMNMQHEVDQSAMLEQEALASSYFDLKKFAQGMAPTMDPMAAPSPDMGMGADPSMPPTDPMAQQQGSPLDSPESLKAFLESSANDPEAESKLLQMVPGGISSDGGDVTQFVSDTFSRYQEISQDQGNPHAEATKMILVGELYEKLKGEGGDTVQGTYTTASIKALVEDSNKAIAAFAKKAASKKTVKTAVAYNLKKEAWSGSREFLNFGPNQMRVLPGGKEGYLGSDWHVHERNKGHDFHFDDNYFVDFDTFWRGNIMDKYSQPYRNRKGEWVGGYMNKRFEVDHNIPVGNDYQLLPGQRRRPILPEFGNTESRLEAARKDMAKERGYNPTDSTAKPYNWKEAAVKKK